VTDPAPEQPAPADEPPVIVPPHTPPARPPITDPDLDPFVEGVAAISNYIGDPATAQAAGYDVLLAELSTRLETLFSLVLPVAYSDAQPDDPRGHEEARQALMNLLIAQASQAVQAASDAAAAAEAPPEG
jgi:hypothetical protein